MSAPTDQLAEWLREQEEKAANISDHEVMPYGWYCVPCGEAWPCAKAARLVLVGIAKRYHEALLAVRRDLDVCDWSCEMCGSDQEMKETDLSDAVDRALARAVALIPKVKP